MHEAAAPPHWRTEGPTWPHHARSRFVAAGGMAWHVQHWPKPNPPTPNPPTPTRVLLLHGTGGSTHCWRGVAPWLAQHAEVLALDLPGHGFSAAPANPQGMSLHGMAQGVAALLAEWPHTPDMVVGHSAGCAVAVRMALNGQLPNTRLLVGIGAALLPWQGLPGKWFGPLARGLASLGPVPKWFAGWANKPAVLQSLVDSTGSTLSDESLALWQRLVARPEHAQATLRMMAEWDLPALQHDLPHLATPLCLLHGSRDTTVRPSQSHQVAQHLAPAMRAGVHEWPTLGHLAPEEAPEQVAQSLWHMWQGRQGWQHASARGA
jgi:magnesium chelatase accessory protein